MLSGIHLSLLIGPLAVPVSAPVLLMDAPQNVQVTSGRDRSGFQLSFTVGKTSLIQTTLLRSGFFDPMSTRVVIVASLNGMPHVLMDGVVTRQESTPSNDPGQSTLTITGEDLSILMDVESVRTSYPNMNDAAQVTKILSKYITFGIQPIVTPPAVDPVRTTNDGVDVQTGTDLAYIRQLAKQSGYIFYIEPGPLPLTSIAYFGPDTRVSIPQPALSVNSDWDTNVDSLNFSFDGLSNKVTKITVFDPVTHKIPIEITLPSIDSIKPPLGARQTPPAKIEFAESASRFDPAEAAKRAFGLANEGSQAVSGTGSLNVTRYGRILRSRQLVGVRGAGAAYDGLYFVESVTHTLKRGEYKQNFTLSRDGLISQTPVVIP